MGSAIRNLTNMANHRTVNPEIWDKLTHQAKWRDLCIVAIESWGYFYLLIQENMATLTDLKNSNNIIDLAKPKRGAPLS